MVDYVGTLFLPGDTINNLNKSEKTGKIILGPGLRQESETIIVSKPGILRHKEPNVYWIDSHQKRVSNLIVHITNFLVVQCHICQGRRLYIVGPHLFLFRVYITSRPLMTQ